MPRHCTQLLFALIAILVCLGTARPVHAQFTYTVLHNFGDGSVTNDGASPETSLTQGTDGNFYGTTAIGGSANKGTVFKVTPTGTVTILHSFGDGSVANDGGEPNTKLVLGIDGNFYGTTENGGAPIPSGAQAGGTVGTVYKITPSGVLTILHSFGPGCLNGDGAFPKSLTQTPDGTLYGGTYTAGNAAFPHGFGVIFSISPSGTYTIRHVMKLADGAGVTGLIAAPDRNLYGITIAGGGSYYNPGGIGLLYGGTFFKLTPSGTFTTLVDFPDSFGENFTTYYPPSDLFLASDGTFYLNAGSGPSGELEAERPNGGSAEFGVFGQIGVPTGPFIVDTFGNLYKSTGSGTYGEIDDVTPDTVSTVAHTFNGTDGMNPNGVILGTDGNLYGTTSAAGSANGGVIFKLHNAAADGPTTVFDLKLNYPNPSGVDSGVPLSFTVTAMDSHHRIVPGYAGTVHFTSDDPNAILPADATLTNGVGTFQATFFVPNNLTVTDTVTPSITSSGPILVLTAQSFLVTAPASVTPGVPFNITVKALDTIGGTVPGYSGTVHITSTDGAATLPADATLTNGIGTFQVTLRTQGTQTVTATDTVTSSITGGVSTYVPGPATSFAVTAPPTVTKGIAFTITVTARDSTNATASGYSGTVHFTSSEAGATLPANATLTNGVGTFSVTLPTAGNNATVTATDTVTPSITGTSSPFTVALAQFPTGWQMIATPFTGVSTASVVSGGFNNPAYLAYSGVGYASWTTLKSGVGFWINPINGPAFLLDSGALSPKPCSLTLHKGWNIIGSPFLTAEPASKLTVNGSAFLSQSNLIAQVTYTFQAGDTAYETATGSGITLQPFEGYWVYAYSQCTVTFN